MRLTTEDFGDIEDVKAADIDRVLTEDGFGKFTVLSASRTEFIQAASDWHPDGWCQRFIEQHSSDPWVLEYRDGAAGRQYRAEGHVALEQVRQAFLSYLAGGDEWRRGFAWDEVRA